MYQIQSNAVHCVRVFNMQGSVLSQPLYNRQDAEHAVSYHSTRASYNSARKKTHL